MSLQLASIRAVLLREVRAAFLNRYVQVFIIVSLAGGIGAIQVGETIDASAVLVSQLAQYFVSLFALLVGVSSARAEAEEWSILFAQPASRWTSPVGKLVALVAIFCLVLFPLFCPQLFTVGATAQAARLYGCSVGLATVFGVLGLGIGYLSRDRVQGVVLAATAWLVLLFAFDLVALVFAHWALLQKQPDAWVGALMLNPLDAFRIDALMSLQQVPTDAVSKTPLASWWLAHTGQWFSFVAMGWTLAWLGIASAAVSRTEP